KPRTGTALTRRSGTMCFVESARFLQPGSLNQLNDQKKSTCHRPCLVSGGSAIIKLANDQSRSLLCTPQGTFFLCILNRYARIEIVERIVCTPLSSSFNSRIRMLRVTSNFSFQDAVQAVGPSAKE